MALIGARENRINRGTLKVALLIVLAASGVACSTGQDRIHLVVDVPGRSMSKFPFVLAQDQGLYEKYGLDVELQVPLGFWQRVWRRLDLLEDSDIIVEGHAPQMGDQLDPDIAERIALAATDCSSRYYVIGRPDLKTVEDLKGKRLGISSHYTTSGFTGMVLVRRMGWERDRNISVVPGVRMAALREGRVDAYVGGDEELDAAHKEGFSVLFDTRDLHETIAGNSVMVTPEWLQDPMHREAARRFLKATAEAVALFHQRRELVLDALTRLYGLDRGTAETYYERTDYIPRTPFPCVEGVKNVMEVLDLEQWRQRKPEEFYDDSFMRELDQSGFLDSLYK